MPLLRLPAAGLVMLGLSFAGAAADAAVLYKCDAPDGSVAYVGHKAGFRNCKLLATYADPPPSRPAPAARTAPVATAPADAPAAKALPAKPGWTYQENVAPKADFSDVVAAIAGTALAPTFSNVAAGTASSAPVLTPPAPVPPAAPAVAAVKPVVPAAARPPRILRGAVYKVERKDGITEYTNVKPRGSAFAVLFTYIATCVACDVHSKIDFARTALNLDAYKDAVLAAASEYGVDRALLRAVIHAESAFNPLAVSSKGAQGLMQLMPGTAGDLGVSDAFDATENIRGGARYLAQLLKAFGGDARLATAAYNAGPGAVQKYGGVPPYDETQVYVQRVAMLRDRYDKAL